MDETREVSSHTERPGEYVVVARRYRPASFDELIGQEHVARALQRAIETNRVGHAYLFTGARGVGKTSAARILAKALNCEQGPTPTPCNACDPCQSIATGDDVDVLEIDGASNRGIDEIRQLRQNVGVRPSRSRFKIYIIDEVHMLTKEAFNALLKTLEEPPDHVKFVFATTEPNKIPVTILSRCQRFDFAGIDTGKIETRLRQIAEQEDVRIDAEALQLLARRAAGSMRDSQSLLEQLLSLGAREISSEDVNALLGTAPAARLGRLAEELAAGNARGALEELAEAVRQGAEVGQVVDQLLGYYRDLMAAAVGCPQEQFLYVTASGAAEAEELAQSMGVERILAVLQVLEQAAGQLRSSINGRIVAEMALVRVAHLDRLDDIAGLIESLQDGATPSWQAASAGGRGRKAASQKAAPKKNSAAVTDGSVAPQPAKAADPLPPEKSEPQPADTPDLEPLELTEERVNRLWREVLEGLSGLVADQAGQCEYVAISAPNRLVARFPAKYNLSKEFCAAPEQKSRLEQALSAAAGGRVQIDFELLPEDDQAPERSPERKSVLERRHRAEIVSRPIVRRAIELFGDEQPRIVPPSERKTN